MKALQNQTLADIAIIAAGSLEALFLIAAANGTSITYDPVPGIVYAIPATLPADDYTLQYLQQNGIQPGTKAPAIMQGGLGAMAIGSTFTIA